MIDWIKQVAKYLKKGISNMGLRQIVTEVDDETLDINRIMFLIATFAFVAMTVWAVAVNKQPFDWIGYGGGFGAILAAGGGAIAFNRRHEQAELDIFEAKTETPNEPII